MWLSDIKSVREYVKQFCLSIRDLVLLDRIKSIILSVLTHTGERTERCVIELPSDFARTVFYALPSTAHRSDLEISNSCAELLGEALQYLERKVNNGLPTVAEPGRDWEIVLDVKRNAVQGGMSIECPTGHEVMRAHAERDHRDASMFSRSPIKSCTLADSVVLSLFTDSKT